MLGFLNRKYEQEKEESNVAEGTKKTVVLNVFEISRCVCQQLLPACFQSFSLPRRVEIMRAVCLLDEFIFSPAH